VGCQLFCSLSGTALALKTCSAVWLMLAVSSSLMHLLCPSFVVAPQIKALCEIPRGTGLPLIPFYARLTATLAPVYPDVPQGGLLPS
jgi:hypothetical protein